MRQHVAAALAAALTVVAVCSVHGPAAATHVGVGRTCGMSTSTDPTAPTLQTGPIGGGSLTASAPGAGVWVTCSVNVGLANSTHDGVVYAEVWGGGTQSATAGPLPLSFVWSAGDPVYLCTEWNVNGTSYYYDATAAAFSTASTVDCAPVASQPTGPGTWSHTASGTPTQF